MDDLKLIVASNMIRLRTNAGLTQAELGEKLNYSDKSISKWERAEALPDVQVLKNLSEIFGVSVDHLLTTHNEWKPEKKESIVQKLEELPYNPAIITFVSLAGIWTLALLIFIIFWILGAKVWLIFAGAVPVSLITLLVLNSVWNKGKGNILIVSALVLCLLALVYLCLLPLNPWQLFLLAVPLEMIVYLSFHIRKRPKAKDDASKAVTTEN